MSLHFVQLSEDDLEAVCHIAGGRGRRESVEEWRAIFRSARVFGARSLDGRLISRIARFDFGSSCSFGKLMAERGGTTAPNGLSTVGVQTLRWALEASPLPDLVFAIVTPPGRLITRRLGFREVERVITFQADAVEPVDALRVDILNLVDLPKVRDLDLSGFGADRWSMVNEYIRMSRISVAAWSTDGQIIGYGVLKPPGMKPDLGPIVANSHESAMAIVSYLVRFAGNAPVRVDVPQQQDEFGRALSSIGFAAQDAAPGCDLRKPESCWGSPVDIWPMFSGRWVMLQTELVSISDPARIGQHKIMW